MKQNNKKFNNAVHKFVGVLDKCAFPLPVSFPHVLNPFPPRVSYADN